MPEMKDKNQLYKIRGARGGTKEYSYSGDCGYGMVKANDNMAPLLYSSSCGHYPVYSTNGINIYDSSTGTGNMSVVRLSQKEMVQVCMDVYEHVGIVRNIIDLISDFVADGIEITHPKKNIRKFWKEWTKLVNLKDRTERIANTTLKAGFCAIERKRGKIILKDRNIKRIIEKNKEAPIEYSIIDPRDINIYEDPTKENKMIYEKTSLSTIYNSRGDKIVHRLEENDNFAIFNYKKDDWEPYPRPFHYAALNDILQENIFMKMDRITANNTINQIRIWKIGGELKNGAQVLPSNAAYAKLAAALGNAPKGGTMDLLWDYQIEMDSTETNVDKILSQEKYKHIKSKILESFGIAQVLIDGTGDGSYSNQYLSVKSLAEKIVYLREMIIRWIEKEIDFICDKFNFKQRPIIKFKDINLGDENGRLKLIMDLYDRNIISKVEMLSYVNQDWDIEKEKIDQENEEEKNDEKLKKVGPYSNNQDDSNGTGKIGGDGRPANQPGDKSQSVPRNTKPQGANIFSQIVFANELFDNIKNRITKNYVKENGVDNVRELEQKQKDELDNIILASFFTSIDKNEINIDKNKIYNGLKKYNKALAEASNGKKNIDKKIKNDIAVLVWIDINGDKNG